MNRYSARDLITTPMQDILSFPPVFELEFEDGEVIETTPEQTAYCRLPWQIFHVVPKTPIQKHHHICGKRPGKETHNDLSAKVIFDAFYHYRDHEGVLLDMVMLGKHAYEVTSALYNFIATDLGEWVSSASYIDFMEVMFHPPIMAANLEVQSEPLPSPIFIKQRHDIVKNELLTAPEIRFNSIAKAAKSGLVSTGQILQCVASRGYLTDVDQYIFRKPIVHGFAHGLTMAESATESRSAAMSHFFQKRPMADTEYLNRVVQIAAQAISRIHYTDCNTPKVMQWHLRNQADLEASAGAHLCENPDNPQVYRPILKTDVDLIGKTFYIRSPQYCAHLDNGGVCSACFGELALSVPPGDNIGHMSATKLQGPLGQSVLSVKHEHESAASDAIELSAYDQDFLTVGTDDNLYMHKRLKKTPLKMIIHVSEAPGMYDLHYVKTVRDLMPTRITELTRVDIVVGDKTYPVTCSTETRKTYLSREALEYVKKVGWLVNGLGNYVIDFSEWDFRKPLMNVPQYQFSAPDHMRMIESMIKCKSTRNFKSLMDYDTPDARLAAFHELVSLRLTVNIVHLSVIILAIMARNPDADDYWTPAPKWEGRPVPFKTIQEKRSMGGAMANEKQPSVIFSTDAFNIRNRPPHTLDPLLMGY